MNMTNESDSMKTYGGNEADKGETVKQAQILGQTGAIPRPIQDIKLMRQQTNTLPKRITGGCLINPSGKKLWEFKDESLLKSACGVTADKHLNIYVAYFENNSIVVISPDD
ncbi:Hypothetical predicted protein [Mytilus galloprovincialis]|uniref:Uncharacterized protein n=1 Tax=Mytilus galloprovincialis TaxID=29158 RepID=A0A8B6HPG0_MYTGA|nr:Hypothetical predicted protein [Mytilus galloprovincialis]